MIAPVYRPSLLHTLSRQFLYLFALRLPLPSSSLGLIQSSWRPQHVEYSEQMQAWRWERSPHDHDCCENVFNPHGNQPFGTNLILCSFLTRPLSFQKHHCCLGRVHPCRHRVPELAGVLGETRAGVSPTPHSPSSTCIHPGVEIGSSLM